MFNESQRSFGNSGLVERPTLLPTCFANTRNQALVGQLAKTNTADPKLAVNGPRSATELTTVLASYREFGSAISFGYFAFACHGMFIRS